tara:strand:- start:1066 stop:1248 length:183 start_codon:yes stop_codon:yes gene_type:complete
VVARVARGEVKEIEAVLAMVGKVKLVELRARVTVTAHSAAMGSEISWEEKMAALTVEAGW